LETFKIFRLQSKEQFDAAIYWEQGRNVSVVFEVNASGTFIPPVLAYTRS
jgi:hypothetical protein